MNVVPVLQEDVKNICVILNFDLQVALNEKSVYFIDIIGLDQSHVHESMLPK